MVQLLESIVGVYERHGMIDQAVSLRDLAQDLRSKGNTPEILKNVVIYDRSERENMIYAHTNGFVHDRGASVAFVRGVEIHIGPTENSFLTELEDNENKFVSVRELQERVQGEGSSSYSLKQTVYRSRMKIESDPKMPDLILFSKEHGYILKDLGKEIKLVKGKDGSSEIVLAHSGFTFYPDRNWLVNDKGEFIALPIKQSKYLNTLCLNDIATFELLEPDYVGSRENLSSVVRNTVMRVRRKVEPDKNGNGFIYIKYIDGIGYRLHDPGKSERPV